MLKILYEDEALLVVEKPAGMESQSSRRLEPDMVSEIKKYRNRCGERQLSTKSSTVSSTGAVEPYVGVVHRLDKPVGGVMVYAKTREAAASLSRQVQDGRMKKTYRAAVCGKLVDNGGNFVDYLLKDGKSSGSRIVDKGTGGAKRAELHYRVLNTRSEAERTLSLVEIELLTGRYHQIRVQFAAHGTPLWGDARYNPEWGGTLPGKALSAGGCTPSGIAVVPEPLESSGGAAVPESLEPSGIASAPESLEPSGIAVVPESLEPSGSTSAPEFVPSGLRRPVARKVSSLGLAAVGLSFIHPVTGRRMEFTMEPQGTVFQNFKKDR